MITSPALHVTSPQKLVRRGRRREAGERVTVFKLVLSAVLIASAMWRLVSPAEFKVRSTIAALCLGAATWLAGSAFLASDIVPVPIAAALVQLGIGMTAGAGLLAAALPRGRSGNQSRWVLGVLIVEPIAIATLTALSFGVDPANPLDSEFLHSVQMIYILALVLSIVAELASLSYAPGSRASIALYGFMTLLAVIVLTEMLDLQVGSILAAVAALAALELSRKPGDVFAVPPPRTEILDDLGAYVFAFDSEGLLSDWNAPAREMMLAASGISLETGQSSVALFGIDLPLAEGSDVTIGSGASVRRLEGYTVDARSDRRGSNHRWVVVLQDQIGRNSNRLAPRLSSEGLDASTGAFTRAAIIQRLGVASNSPLAPSALRVEIVSPDAESVDDLVATVTAQLRKLCPPLQIGRVEPLTLVAIVPPHVDPIELANRVHKDESSGIPLVVVVIQPDLTNDPQDFVRSALSPNRLEGARRWQPKWY